VSIFAWGKFYAIMHGSATAMLHVTKSGVTFLIEAELSMGRSKEVERSCSGLRLNSSPFWREGERERVVGPPIPYINIIVYCELKSRDTG